MRTLALQAAAILAVSAMVSAQEGLPVRVTVEPSSIYAGDKVTITAITTPGASCALTIRFRAGVLQGPTRTADQSGKVVWTPVTSGRAQQIAGVTVNCALGDQKGAGAALLTIR